MWVDPKSKIKTSAELSRWARLWRAQGRRTVLANGCFDLLHVGHVRYLQAAKALGDILIVAINGDSSLGDIKGSGRPIQPQDERAEIVGALECVDYVTIFDALSADTLLAELTPDVHAKGTDYTAGTVPERTTVLSYGGTVAIVGDPKEHSSRDLIQTILSKFKL